MSQLPPAAADYNMPKNACNAHLHIIDPCYPNNGQAAEQCGTIDTYRAVSAQFHIPRAVFVQAKPFALDNACLIDAIASFGKTLARGIAVVTEHGLIAMHEAGIRGIRFSVWNPNNAVVSMDDCKPLAERIAALGWNIQLHMRASQIAMYADLIRQLPCRVVIDHIGRLDPKLGIQDPAFPVICDMIDRGNTWIKLSGPYLNTTCTEPWPDCVNTARAFATFAPERILWGSDFPHVTERVKPDAHTLINLIPLWMESAHTRYRALVKNPEEVYGF